MFTTLFSLKSARTFRQFRVAVFGVAGFLRLAWAFVLALNAFSLTTQTNKLHEVISILLFSVNAAAFATIVFVGTLEAFHFRLSFWTSRVNFELGWMSFFLVLEIIGATIFTIVEPTFSCSTIIRINGDAQGAIFADSTPLGSQRPTTAEEASTCRLFDKTTLFGSWIAVFLSGLYIFYFALLCIVAQGRNSRVWYTQVNHFDWSVTSEPIDTSPVDPASIKRPHNPHLSKESNESDWSLPPVFVNPFDARKYSADSNASGVDITDARQHSSPMDRHQVMAQYRIDPYPLPPVPLSYETGLTPPPRSEMQRFSALGLEGMDRPATAPTQPKRKPTLSIHIPTQESQAVVPIGAADEDYDRIGRTMSAVILSPESQEIFSARTFDMSEEATIKIGRHMSIPFASEESVSPQHPATSTVSLGQKTVSTVTAVASHGTISTHAGSIPSIASRAMASTVAHGHETIQFVHAENSYPTIQHTPKRQSTLVRQDSMTARLAMRFAPVPPLPAVLPPQPSTSYTGGGLPLHRQDVHNYGPRSAAMPQHHRSYSDTQGWYPPRVSQQYPLQQAPAQTWPRGYQELTRGTPQTVDATHMARIPFFIPPAPNYSPVNVRPPSSSSNGSYGRPPMQGPGHGYHSRSSSTPTFQLSPALRDALAPALRDSRSFRGNTPSPAQRSVPNHPFLDDNPFGGSRGHSTDSPRSEMMITTSTPTTPDNGKRRASKLRKSLPRGL